MVVGERKTLASSSSMCAACELAVLWAKNQMDRNASKDQFMGCLDQLCDRLSNPDKQVAVDCNNLSSMPVCHLEWVKLVWELPVFLRK